MGPVAPPPEACMVAAPQVRPPTKWMGAEHVDRGVAQFGSAPYWGCGGRWFESSRPDHGAGNPKGLPAFFLVARQMGARRSYATTTSTTSMRG